MVAVTNLDEELLSQMALNTGETLSDFSRQQPVLLIFLRHFGCTFCREALADLSKQRESIENQGFSIVLVHMATNDIAERYFNRYELDGARHISDPDCKFYAAFGLVKGNFTQLFGLSTWIRGFSAGVVAGHGLGPQLGDGFQMPGVFVIRDGEVKESFVHKLASDRPDYIDLVKCCVIEE